MLLGQDRTRHRGSVFQVGEILQRSSPGMPFKSCFRVHQWRGVENARVETFGPQDDRVKYKPTDKKSSHQNEATGPKCTSKSVSSLLGWEEEGPSLSWKSKRFQQVKKKFTN